MIEYVAHGGLMKKTIDNTNNEEKIVIKGLRVAKRDTDPVNCHILEKMVESSDGESLVVGEPGSAWFLKKGEVLDPDAYVEIVKYLEVSTEKVKLDRLLRIIQQKRQLQEEYKALSSLHKQELDILNLEYQKKVADINQKYFDKETDLNYQLNTHEFFSENIAKMIGDESANSKTKVKRKSKKNG